MNGPDNTGPKVRTDALPPRALLETAGAMTDGINNYGERNWEAGLSFGSLYGAILRHLFKWWSGEEHDSDSGRHHLAHVAASVLMLLELVLLRRGVDDRPDDAQRSPVRLRIRRRS